MNIDSFVVQIYDTFSSFVDFFFRPVDNSFFQSIFGEVSLATVIFGAGLTVFIVWQLVTWVLNTIT